MVLPLNLVRAGHRKAGTCTGNTLPPRLLQIGEKFCGKIGSTASGYNYMCDMYFCPEMNADGHGHMGANLCPNAHMCNAMCGYCQNPSVGEVLPDGSTTDVVVHATSSNIPTYYDISFVAGQTYRFQGWTQENITTALMILVDPSGYPIRRANTNTGRTVGDKFEDLDFSGLNNIKHDAASGCVGERNITVKFTFRLIRSI